MRGPQSQIGPPQPRTQLRKGHKDPQKGRTKTQGGTHQPHTRTREGQEEPSSGQVNRIGCSSETPTHTQNSLSSRDRARSRTRYFSTNRWVLVGGLKNRQGAFLVPGCYVTRTRTLNPNQAYFSTQLKWRRTCLRSQCMS